QWLLDGVVRPARPSAGRVRRGARRVGLAGAGRPSGTTTPSPRSPHATGPSRSCCLCSCVCQRWKVVFPTPAIVSDSASWAKAAGVCGFGAQRVVPAVVRIPGVWHPQDVGAFQVSAIAALHGCFRSGADEGALFLEGGGDVLLDAVDAGEVGVALLAEA